MIQKQTTLTNIALLCPHDPGMDRMSTLFIMPRYGTIAIANALSRAGYQVRTFCEFIGGRIDWDFVIRADAVCIGLMSFCVRRGYSLADRIRLLTDAPIIFGGAHATVKPSECLQHGHFAVRNEGEGPLLALLQAIGSNRDFSTINGLSYWRHGVVRHNPDQVFLCEADIDHPQDISLLEGYGELRESFSLHRPRVHLQTVQTSRGCPYNCSFCVAPRELGRKYRTKSIDTVLADVQNGVEVTGSKTFIFVDNEFTVNERRAQLLLKALREAFDGELNLTLFARLSVAGKPHLLDLMKRAGVHQLFVGIESVSEATLQQYQKHQTTADIARCLDAIHARGIQTMGAIILGGEDDTPQTIDDSLAFTIDHGVHLAQFYSLYDFPGKKAELGISQAIADHRFIHRDWRFFNSAFVVHYPRRMRPSTLQQGIIDAYERFYARDRCVAEETMDAYSRLATKLFIVNPNLRLMRRYVDVLQQLEHGLYADDGTLLEDRLPGHAGIEQLPALVDIPWEDQ